MFSFIADLFSGKRVVATNGLYYTAWQNSHGDHKKDYHYVVFYVRKNGERFTKFHNPTKNTHKHMALAAADREWIYRGVLPYGSDLVDEGYVERVAPEVDERFLLTTNKKY